MNIPSKSSQVKSRRVQMAASFGAPAGARDREGATGMAGWPQFHMFVFFLIIARALQVTYKSPTSSRRPSVNSKFTLYNCTTRNRYRPVLCRYPRLVPSGSRLPTAPRCLFTGSKTPKKTPGGAGTHKDRYCVPCVSRSPRRRLGFYTVVSTCTSSSSGALAAPPAVTHLPRAPSSDLRRRPP